MKTYDTATRVQQSARLHILEAAIDALIAVCDNGDGNQEIAVVLTSLRRKTRNIDRALEEDAKERDAQATESGEARYRKSVLSDECAGESMAYADPFGQ